MRTLPTFALFVAAVSFPIIGCGPVQEEGPSYADLVVTYNAEVEALDRLERKRAEMIAAYERTLRPSAEDALKSLNDVLNSQTAAEGEGASELPADPNEMLDQAVANAERSHEAASKLLAAAVQPSGDGESLESQYSEEFKQQLAEIDAEIAKQRERVERARKARDEAEAK